MNCPACTRPLKPMEAGGVALDVCLEGCGGIWFDNHEFKKFDEPHESAGEVLCGIETTLSDSADQQARHSCPKCQDITMSRHFVSVKRHVEIDECAQCGGIWLDAGELFQIRNQFKTEQERKDAAKAYFSEVFDNELMQVKQQSQDKLAQARRFANMFRYITPSHYIPGKQDWGAF